MRFVAVLKKCGNRNGLVALHYQLEQMHRHSAVHVAPGECITGARDRRAPRATRRCHPAEGRDAAPEMFTVSAEITNPEEQTAVGGRE